MIRAGLLRLQLGSFDDSATFQVVNRYTAAVPPFKANHSSSDALSVATDAASLHVRSVASSEAFEVEFRCANATVWAARLHRSGGLGNLTQLPSMAVS